MERTILVAEDSPTQAERVRLLLEAEGYRVETVSNGREGLERVRVTPPDLIISDVVMPEMDGYAFCRAVKSTDRTKRIPFVLLTQERTPANVVMGLQQGADNFITKPFEDDYLLERVRRIFENLEFRRQGRLDVEVAIRVRGHEVTFNADKQQIVELLFSTLEELVQTNGRLEESERAVERYARELEAKVRERTRQLQESEEKYRTLVENIPEVMWETDRHGNIVYVSPNIEKVWGFKAEDIHRAGADLWFGRIHPDDVERVRERYAALFGGASFDVEYRIRRADERWIWVHARAVSTLEKGGVLYACGLLSDITERRRVQDEIQRQREALSQTEKLATMGTLLAGVAHELNNPLAVIAGHAALLRQMAADDALVPRAEKIAKAAERCSRIVRNFLALARQYPPERQQMSLNQIVLEAVELLAYQTRVDGVEVALDLAEDLPALWADPHQLHQVAVNLISNAHQAMRQSTGRRRLALTTRADTSRTCVRLSVADTGPGIPPEIRARIFEPFFTTKPPGEGTGLGLALCKGIVDEHGGTITVDSTPGHGADFVVELPPGHPTSVPDVPAPAGTTPGHSKVLVVDDEQAVAEVLADLLAADGHEVETAANGATALEKLRDGTYDLVLSDVRMPEVDGQTLYQELKHRHPTLLPRFIFVTGDALNPETKQFIEATRVPTVSKPFNLQEIRRTVQRVLGNSRG